MAEQQVNLQDLDLNQLQDVKKQLDSVCGLLNIIEGYADEVGTRTFDKLVSATQASSGKVQIMRLGYLGIDTSVERSADCLSVRNELTNTGKEILIPLTSSLYVPGRLTDVENVVIDVGTGYYVKKVSLLIRVIS